MREALSVSPLGFGCAPVMGKVGRRAALAAFAEAFECGVRHFDVARSYGFGRAEGVLGEFLRDRRDRVTLASKFGVVPGQLSWPKRLAMPLARLVARASPGAGRGLRRQSASLLSERDFSVAHARRCLETSLRELDTDYLDFYFVHEPLEAQLGEREALIAWLEQCVTAGKIRRWGMAYRAPADHAWAGAIPGDAVQAEGNLLTAADCVPLLTDPRQRFITRPLGGGVSYLDLLTARVQALPAALDTGLGPAELALAIARRLAGPGGTLVAAMFDAAHLRQNVVALRALGANTRAAALVDALLATATRSTAEPLAA